ncbi:c-type cytochrome biogenesis protein CcmI [Marinobacter salinisoli]|uniref:C-type cytochrome biogenesis protein CcmI n=1 Tax=Marinobacter salinisoli TaxID=2769486 RepID=A0ABX7MS93_9GAMM|nr:c-type cytochrome biogenesis protein CcmI [Marinobacter salinisoli]QSP94367.1 c-type cytochrome biogenesis protein CcmI [Marinobacter salinisoli]
MTQTFWIAASILIILALAFILYPVFFHRPQAKQTGDLKRENLMAYQGRLQELDAEYEAGNLDDDGYRQLREELAGTMLEDIPEEAPARPVVTGRKSALAIGLLAIALVPAASVLLYQKWGAMDKVEQFHAMQQLGNDEGNRQEQMAGLIEQLRAKLEANPDNPDGWAMLGQSYMRLERYEEAAWAFQNLAVNVGDDGSRAVALGLAAQALFFDSQGVMTESVTDAIDAARALNPDEVNALGLLGIHAFSQQEYRQAIRHWERIVTVAPDHPQLPSIQGGIREAYNRLGEEPPKAPVAQAVEGPAVTVRVSLADALAREVPEDTTLFVFARRVDGAGGPPLAIKRLTAGALPAEIRLDDSSAMSPEATISSAERVMVVARLSRSGSAMPQAGDWQGRLDAPVEVVDGDSQPVELVIDQQLTN